MSPPVETVPLYTLDAVAQLVGLSAKTVRAWERRYGFPAPRRTAQGARLYSAYEVRVLRWLKTQIEAGLNISLAAQRLAELRATGLDPVAADAPTATAIDSIANLQARCLTAFLQLDNTKATEVFRLAFARYAIDQVLFDLVQPVMTELGERWRRGEMPIAVEHFATQFCLRHLQSLFTVAGAPTQAGLIVAGCAPGEAHELGLLTVVVMLRWRGWEVKYLGANLSLERLEEALGGLQPQALLFSATRPEAAHALQALPQTVGRFPSPPPLTIVGGQAFINRVVEQPQPYHLLNLPLRATIDKIEQLIHLRLSETDHVE